MRTQRAAYWRAILAGLTSVIAVALTVLFIATATGLRSPARTSERAAAARLGATPADMTSAADGRVVDREDLTSLRAARRLAREQLRDATPTLRACPQRGRISARRWRDCVRWPLAHLAMAGRTAAGLFYFLAGRDGLARCRDRAMGEANGLRLLAGNADQVVRGLANTSPQARSERDLAFAATLRLSDEMHNQLRRPLRRCAQRI